MVRYFSLITLLLMSSLMSCNPVGEQKSQLQLFEVEASDFDQIINNKALPSDPNINEDKTILNRDYPIEIALYNDGKWYYDLPNLDTGTGTWEFQEGKIKLYAKRSLFDMHIDLVATKQEGEQMAIKFSDRFGPKVLHVEKINLD